MDLELDECSEYSSAGSADSGISWSHLVKNAESQVSEFQQYYREMALKEQQPAKPPAQRANSFTNVRQAKTSVEAVMNEFRMNGSDSPYDPEEDIWSGLSGVSGARTLAGMGPSSIYLRQKSWPDPESTPSYPLPKVPSSATRQFASRVDNRPWNDLASSDEFITLPAPRAKDLITPEQRRVLHSLPNAVLHALLYELQQHVAAVADAERKRGQRLLPDECRFCKNNGERDSYYRNHVLKDDFGRVACPVLRAFVCKRCGASGDWAHTLKYCPLTTDKERQHSAAMMRSVRLASGRKRNGIATSSDGQANDSEYVRLGEAPSLFENFTSFEEWNAQPLEPNWAALEKKLME